MEKAFIRTTNQRPKLTSSLLKNKPQVESVVPVPQTVKKWNLNKILFISFVLFTIFFLYNCKYGIFKSTETHNVYPFNVVS
jgi:hypothetical protein